MRTALESINQSEQRESSMADQIKVSQEASAQRDADFQKLIDELEEKLERVRISYDQKEEQLREMASEVEQLRAEVKTKSTKAEQEAADAKRKIEELEAAKHKAVTDARSGRRIAEKAQAAAELEVEQLKKKLADVEGNLSVRVAEGIQTYRDSQPFMDEVQACYSKGLNHMARCTLDAIARGKTIDLQRLAVHAESVAYSRRLSRYHSLVPYPEDEIEEYNDHARQNGLPLLENLPAVEAINLDTLRETAEESDEEVEPEPIVKQVEIETPVGDPEKEIEVMITVDPDTDQVVIGEDSVADVDSAVGKDQVAGDETQSAA